MASDAGKVEMLFFPYVGGGHLIPMVDLARVFASRGAKSTIITAPDNALLIHKAILRDQKLGHDINLHTLESPSAPVSFGDMSAPPFTDTTVLREPLRQLLIQRPPDCVVTDMFHRWVADDVHELGIRIIVFNGSGCFPRCGEDSLRRYSPHEKVGSESEVFVLPGLPDRIELTRSQVPHFDRTPNKRPEDDELGSQDLWVGCQQLLRAGACLCRLFQEPNGEEGVARRTGLSLQQKYEDKAGRGQEASIDEQACLNWLDSKQPNSVLYVSFGVGSSPPSTTSRDRLRS
ncbi:Abscisate beta-glucosyltransferase [Vitis vinifera]|uniref:Abscisate beta-glucosyltransferase n=1 Tax=Vitis vinifera TaxID=29760 RepID=A0A438EPU0_VITVI|nr:Abscisate beta-glucosyltransferase [Vitis vinifera]